MTLKKGKKAAKSVKIVSGKKEHAGVKRLFLDIETSPNIVSTWNVGYDLNISYDNIIKERAIICICYKWEHEKTVHSLHWKDGDDKQMVLDFVEIMKSADELVGHNGDKYDLKFLRTRCIYHGVTSLPEFKSIDTLKISRSQFRFNSNRLDYIGSYLGLGRKIKTEFGLWQDVMAGDKKALDKMIAYCIQDVHLLEKVYLKLAGYVKKKTHVGVMLGRDKCTCPSCGSDSTVSDGNIISATGAVKKKMYCTTCDTYFNVSTAVYNKSRGIV